jgi:uncharacterized protein (TIRG00374 family)
VGVWLRSLRWHYLLKPVKSLSANQLFPVVVIGYMANDVLPARIGELVRAYVLGEREGVSKSATLGTILAERVFDGLIMLLFMGVVSLLVPFDGFLQQIIRIAGAVFVGAMIVILVVASSRRLTLQVLNVFLKLAPQSMRPRLERIANAFIEGFAAMQSFRTILVVFALSVLAWLFEAGMYYVLGMSFDLRLPFYVMVLTTAVANLGTMVPSSPGYVGVFEWLCVTTLGLFGVAQAAAFSYTIVLHVALILPVVIWGVFYMWSYSLSLGQASQLGKKAEPLGPNSKQLEVPKES